MQLTDRSGCNRFHCAASHCFSGCNRFRCSLRCIVVAVSTAFVTTCNAALAIAVGTASFYPAQHSLIYVLNDVALLKSFPRPWASNFRCIWRRWIQTIRCEDSQGTLMLSEVTRSCTSGREDLLSKNHIMLAMALLQDNNNMLVLSPTRQRSS